MTNMRVQFTCESCTSSIEVHPSLDATKVKCPICSHEQNATFTQDHMDGNLRVCPCCQRQDFYSQKDFNRKIGVILFVIAAILSIWTYGISLIALWLVDLFLFKKLPKVAACYKCNTLFRDLKNMEQIPAFNHEMNDRIVYSDHDFKGKTLDH
jgi:hypothetical protein